MILGYTGDKEKSRMANYAENFFRRTDAQKEHLTENRIRCDIEAMRELYREIKSYMKKTTIEFIVCSDNPNGTHVFISESFRKAKNEWIRLRRGCNWYSIFAINRDGFKCKVYWCYYEGNRGKIIKFFGEDGEKVCKILTNIGEYRQML